MSSNHAFLKRPEEVKFVVNDLCEMLGRKSFSTPEKGGGGATGRKVACVKLRAHLWEITVKIFFTVFPISKVLVVCSS